MQENTLSSNLTRIKDATDSIRAVVDASAAPIEDVASAVSDLNDEKINLENDLIDAQAEIAELEQEIEEITPKGTINISANNDSLDIAQYAYANVNVAAQDPYIQGIIFYGEETWELLEDINNPSGLLILPANQITEVLSTHNTATFTRGDNMFRQVPVSSAELTNLHTDNMTSFSRMFNEAGNGESLTLNCNTAKATNMKAMFRDNKFHKITFNGTAPLVTNFYDFCTDSEGMIAFIAPNLDGKPTGNRDCNYMFLGCSSLQFIDMRSFLWHLINGGGTRLFNDVPTNCMIVVKDQTEKSWFTQYYPSLTNVQTVAEYESHDPWVDPSEYEPIPGTLDQFNVLDYIYNPGTAWINTNVKLPEYGYTIELEYKPVSTEFNGAEPWLFSVYDNGNGFRVGPAYGDSWEQENAVGAIEPRVFELNTKVYVEVNNTTDSSLPLPLFTQCEPNYYPYPDRNLTGSLYYCKIRDHHNVLIRDYIPVEKISTGQIGLFDKVNNMFYLSPTGEAFLSSEPGGSE